MPAMPTPAVIDIDRPSDSEAIDDRPAVVPKRGWPPRRFLKSKYLINLLQFF